MAKKKEVRLNKIPLGTFLDTLLELYHEGLDYIDIVGIPDEVQDTISILFTKEYMSKEMRERLSKFEDDAIEDDNEISNDDDLNQLI